MPVRNVKLSAYDMLRDVLSRRQQGQLALGGAYQAQGQAREREAGRQQASYESSKQRTEGMRQATMDRLGQTSGTFLNYMTQRKQNRQARHDQPGFFGSGGGAAVGTLVGTGVGAAFGGLPGAALGAAIGGSAGVAGDVAAAPGYMNPAPYMQNMSNAMGGYAAWQQANPPRTDYPDINIQMSDPYSASQSMLQGMRDPYGSFRLR